MASPFAFAAAYAAGAALLIAVAGLPPVIARATTAATAAEAVACLVRWLVLFFTLASVVPPYKKVLDDFGAMLPLHTETVIRASDAAGLWMPGLLIVAAAETIAFYRLYADPAKRPKAKRLSWLLTASAIAAVVGVIASVALPLLRLADDLG
jgi:hypothetical protein